MEPFVSPNDLTDAAERYLTGQLSTATYQDIRRRLLRGERIDWREVRPLTRGVNWLAVLHRLSRVGRGARIQHTA